MKTYTQEFREKAVAEDLAPMVEALVAREYGRALLVAHRHELEEEVRIAFADGEEAHLVDNQDRVGEIELEPFREVVLLGGSP